MIRQAAAVVVVLLLSPSWVNAQGTEMTVNVASASVHKSPTTASPVIGYASRGAKLQVTRNVGDWVKVSWPAATDGVGYVRTTMGTMAQATTSKTAIQSTAAASPTAAPATPRLAASTSAEPAQTGNRLPVQTAPKRGTASHLFGLGAHLGGPTLGVGGSARMWAYGRLGLQFGLSRYEVSSPIDLGTMTSTEFGPSALYAFNDRVADYTWLRPYVGAGLNFYHSSITSPAFGTDVSDARWGSQLFGGGELSFASVPQVAISTELSYRWFDEPSPGLNLGGMGLSVAAHWYVK
jgi:SH3 domain-containing protein